MESGSSFRCAPRSAPFRRLRGSGRAPNVPFLYFIRVTTEDQFVDLDDGNNKCVKLPQFLIQCRWDVNCHRGLVALMLVGGGIDYRHRSCHRDFYRTVGFRQHELCVPLEHRSFATDWSDTAPASLVKALGQAIPFCARCGRLKKEIFILAVAPMGASLVRRLRRVRRRSTSFGRIRSSLNFAIAKNGGRVR